MSYNVEWRAQTSIVTNLYVSSTTLVYPNLMATSPTASWSVEFIASFRDVTTLQSLWHPRGEYDYYLGLENGKLFLNLNLFDGFATKLTLNAAILEIDKVYHIMVSSDGTGNYTLRLAEQGQSPTTVSGSLPTPAGASGDNKFFSSISASSRYVKGQFKLCRIWGEERTATDFDAGFVRYLDPGLPKNSNLLLQYEFNETSGTSVPDSSGNANTGTLSGGYTWVDISSPTVTTATDITDLFYDLTGLTAETDYEFRVQEDDGTNVSGWSDWTGFTTAAAATSVTMTISEATTAADTESAQANLISTISETSSATDTTTGKLSASLSLNESAGASDTDQGQYATSQEIIEAVQANDLASTLFHALLTQNLSALASDTVSLKANYGLTLNETAAGVDSATGKASFNATLSESAGATDTGTGKASLTATISESAQGNDSVSLPADGTVTISIGEASVASDGVSMSASFSMTLSESAQASDDLAGRATLLATIAEALSASDSFGGFSPSVYTITIGEAVTALDSISASLAGLRGFVTATITIDSMIAGTVTTESAIAGTLTTEPIITGTITVS